MRSFFDIGGKIGHLAPTYLMLGSTLFSTVITSVMNVIEVFVVGPRSIPAASTVFLYCPIVIQLSIEIFNDANRRRRNRH